MQLRVRFEVMNPGGTTLLLEIREENGRLYTSWEDAFANSNRQYRANKMIEAITVDDLDQRIEELGNDIVIKKGEPVFDPSYCSLTLTDRSGNNSNYCWSDDDEIPRDLEKFLMFLGTAIDEAPFLLL